MEITTDTKIIIGVLISTVVIIVGGAWIAGSRDPAADGQITANQPERLLRAENNIQVGSSDPKVTVVEFIDFQCPACAGMHPVLKQVREHYRDEDVAFVFRHFPLSQHQYAQAAAEASEAANEQGKFWEYVDVVFANQADINNENLENFAEEVGLDMDEFKAAIEDGIYRDVVLADLADGRAVGVNSTPSIYINDVLYRGFSTFEGLQEAIDEALLD